MRLLIVGRRAHGTFDFRNWVRVSAESSLPIPR